MDADEARGLNDLYASLFQTLDGLWFVKVEEALGFEKALAIDDAVWRGFGQREARRLVRFYQNLHVLSDGDDPIHVLKSIIGKSLFNKTLAFTIEEASERGFVFVVDACKTHEGMRKIGRSDEQLRAVCVGIGMAFFESFAQAVDDRFVVECLHAPLVTADAWKQHLCAWRFSLRP